MAQRVRHCDYCGGRTLVTHDGGMWACPDCAEDIRLDLETPHWVRAKVAAAKRKPRGWSFNGRDDLSDAEIDVLVSAVEQ